MSLQACSTLACCAVGPSPRWRRDGRHVRNLDVLWCALGPLACSFGIACMRCLIFCFWLNRVDANTIAWRHDLEEAPGKPRSFHLHYSKNAGMSVSGAVA